MRWAVSAADGKKQAECRLDAPPVFDGMAAANGCLVQRQRLWHKEFGNSGEFGGRNTDFGFPISGDRHFRPSAFCRSFRVLPVPS